LFVKKSSFAAGSLTFLGIGKALADGDGYSSKKRVLAYEFFTVTAGESIDFTSPGEDPPTTGQLIAAEDKGMTLVLEGLLDKTFGQLTKEQWGWVDKQAQRIDQWDEMTNSPQFNLTYLGNDQWRITPGGFDAMYVHYWLV